MDALNNTLRGLQVGQSTTGNCTQTQTNATPGEGGSFKDLLMKNLNEVNQLQQDADKTLDNYVTGKSQNMAEVISASQKATMAFSMLTQIRNKLQDAYDEVKNLRV
ncbi:MAG: flagellar hook-basal body complex protein FliE [Phycisphaerae bacterium]